MLSGSKALLPAAGFTVLLAAATSVPVAEPPELGMKPAAVIAAFGVPHYWASSAAGLTFRYEGTDDQLHEFVFHRDVAIAVPADGFKLAHGYALVSV